jgi:hypothetical protein
MRNDEVEKSLKRRHKRMNVNTGERMPSENELAAARFQGRYVALIASKLAQYREEIMEAMWE